MYATSTPPGLGAFHKYVMALYTFFHSNGMASHNNSHWLSAVDSALMQIVHSRKPPIRYYHDAGTICIAILLGLTRDFISFAFANLSKICHARYPPDACVLFCRMSNPHFMYLRHMYFTFQLSKS